MKIKVLNLFCINPFPLDCQFVLLFENYQYFQLFIYSLYSFFHLKWWTSTLVLFADAIQINQSCHRLVGTKEFIKNALILFYTRLAFVLAMSHTYYPEDRVLNCDSRSSAKARPIYGVWVYLKLYIVFFTAYPGLIGNFKMTKNVFDYLQLSLTGCITGLIFFDLSKNSH